ncbi:MAG TPA: beta-ketoacyl synthase N-terminal-like domain-containing protein [Pyrinomonadaceae bacterium]
MSTEHDPTEDFSTLVELLRWRAARQPEQIALTFLHEGETEETNLTYADLDRRARSIAARLQAMGVAGERALLLYPSGLDFIAALFGCFYAGVIAVPAYPPHANRPLPPRLQALKSDAQASLILTTTQILSNVTGRLTDASEWESLRWLATDSIETSEAEAWRDALVTGDSLAFLQYTSGSTTSPKGVMVTHSNLLANERMIKDAFAHRAHPTFVIWLPLFHDMGLIGNVLQSIYVCGRAVLMSPSAFLVKPDRWLRAISHYRADISGAPNFAYDLCVDRISAEQRESLDLSSWELAFNGAEPINYQTIDRFVDAFGPCGFRRQAFYPCYGLAEATVFVAGGERVELPVVRSLQSASLERNQAIESGNGEESKVLVGCGKSWLEQEIAIVDAESRTRCAENQVGEIWASGPHIARGYWNRPIETEQTFNAYIEDGKDAGRAVGPFLRTGDLGFLKDGELFVTGRLKDLIIIRGRNHYPHDIEWTAEQSHAALRQGVCAAFSVEVEGEERLAIVVEVRRHFQSSQTQEIVDAIRERVADSHELEVYGVSLLRTGHIPKTTSGKVQRRACRDGFLAGSLKVVGEWVQKIQAHEVREQVPAESAQANRTGDAPTAEAIQAWLVTHLAARTGVEAHLVDVRKSYKSYGLDSVSVVVLIGELGEWLGQRLSPTLMYEYPNIASLSQHLSATTTSARVSALAPEMIEKPSPVAGTTREPLAIIGIGCRFPGANNATAFWEMLRDGVDAITEVPIERWDARDFYSPTATTRGKMNTRWGGFLEQVDKFDASFFGIAPREAAQMDPQQRLLLEVAWEALEDGGEVAERLSGTRTGVFVGLAQSEYGAFQLSYPTTVDVYATTGGALSIAANRLSYFFDFRGPSMAVDTACSSSLVAVHLACQSLWSGESTLALAGGVNLILSPSVTISFSQGGALSSDGRCKPFDARADGIVRSEGVGLIVLKPLAQALEDGNQIYAVIRGSAVNQDGRSNGITAPNSLAQEAVIQEACRAARVSPGQVQYVETHGTGTLLGDPIEAQALGHALGVERRDGQPCAIGSVKSNIGHAEAAAGIASLIKVALSLKHQAIPPSLHFDEPNPHIPFEELQLRVQQALGPWPEKSGPALAGVSAFGFGGTNAHLILEEAPSRAHLNTEDDEAAARSMHLLPLSAHNAEALQSLALAYRELLSSSDEAGDNGYLSSLCNTASTRRGHLDYRLAVAGSSREEIIERLEAFARGEASNGLAHGRALAGRNRKLVFVFSGYGGQWWGMGRELLEHEPVFLRAVEECDELLRSFTNWSVLAELRADESQSNLDGSNIEITQISLFALQVALAALLRSWGIEPRAVVGHSLGEVAAAHVAGVLSLADAVRVIFHRARLMQRQLEQLDLKGAMASVDLSRAEAEQLLAGYEDRLSIAVHNAPGTVVLAGDAAAIDELLGTLKQRGINGRKVHAPGAGHSPHAEPIKAQLEEALEGLQPGPGSIPVFSTVTGREQEGRKFDAAYWGSNVRQPVLFAEAIEELAQQGHDLFLELSPHPILSPAITQSFDQHKRQADTLPTLRRRRDAQAAMLAALGKLYTHGQSVRWQSLSTRPARLVQLPSYPWQRERFWIEEQGTTNGSDAEKFNGRRKATSAHPLLGQRIRSAAHTGTHLWEKHIEIDLHPYLGTRRIGGRAFMPTAVYMEMVIAAAGEVFGKGAHVLEDVSFQEALVLSDEAAATQTVQVVISNEVSGTASFQFFSLNVEDATTAQQELWTLRARGKIRLAGESASLPQETAPRA